MQLRFGAGFPAPKYGYFRLMRIVTVTVMAITAETQITKVIMFSPLCPEREFPRLAASRPGISFRDP